MQTPSSNNTREDSTHGHHQMVNTEIRLIIFFAAKDGEALYSQQKQDQDLTVAQIKTEKLSLNTSQPRGYHPRWLERTLFQSFNTKIFP